MTVRRLLRSEAEIRPDRTAHEQVLRQVRHVTGPVIKRWWNCSGGTATSFRNPSVTLSAADVIVS